MRVKIGDTWFEATPASPICLELDGKDLENVKNMSPDATLLAYFHDDDPTPVNHKLNWMKIGSKHHG